MARAFLKKITAREVGCESKPGESFVVIGRINRATPQNGQNGPYVKFGGNFHAINEQTGKEFASAVFLSPGIAEDVLYSGLMDAQETGDKTASTEFAMRFKTMATEADAKGRRNAMGYIWHSEFLIEPAGDDPLARLMASVEDKINRPKGTETKAGTKAA